jgi:hypothetical protein
MFEKQNVDMNFKKKNQGYFNTIYSTTVLFKQMECIAQKIFGN